MNPEFCWEGGEGGFSGLIYSLKNVKLKLRCLQWHNFLLKKVISSIELWHKLTLKVSKNQILLPHFWFLPERARHPRKKESLIKATFRCLKVSWGTLVFFQTLPLQICPFTVYFQFDDTKLITEFYATMACSSHFFKTWNNLPRSKNIPFSTPLDHSMCVHRN